MLSVWISIGILTAWLAGFIVWRLTAKELVVRVINKDGSTRLVKINLGRDAEVENLIAEWRKINDIEP